MTLHRHAALVLAAAHLRDEGSALVPVEARRQHPVWVVVCGREGDDQHQLLPTRLLVTDEGAVHPLGLDDVQERAEALGLVSDDPWEREGEGLALLADEDPEEAAGLAALAQDAYERRRREREQRQS